MFSNKLLAYDGLFILYSGFRRVPPLLTLPSIWECEQEFSITMNIKSKNRNQLSGPGHDSVSKFTPCIDQLVEGKKYLIKFSYGLLLQV